MQRVYALSRCLISHGDKGGVELDVTEDERGMAPFQLEMDNMAFIARLHGANEGQHGTALC